MKKNLLLFLCLTSSVAFAQEISVKGKLIGSDDSAPLVGSTIQLTNVKDSTDRKIRVSDVNGAFQFEVNQSAFYTLEITFVGYMPLKKFVRIADKDVDVGTLTLEADSKLLNEIEVKGKAQTAVINGDTTSFNASSYKTNPDATTSDLLKKMPGMIIDGSGVQAQGEQVQRVTIDGREFFSNDPKAAIDNLPAEVVQRIEVIDQLSDQAQFSGFNDGNTTKTINIVTKEEFRNGTFGRLYAGAGTDERYTAGGNINFFEEDTRISVLGLANNINQQNFSAEDLTGVASSGSSRRGGFRGRGRRGSSGVNNFLVGQADGVASTQASGINYIDKWGEKVKVSASYFLNHSENNQISTTNRELFLSNDSSQFYTENSRTFTENWNHRFNMRLTYDINKTNSIIFTPQMSVQQIESMETLTGINSQAGIGELNQTNNDFSSDNFGVNFRSNLLYRHRFAKRGRTISFNLSNSFNDNQGESNLRATNQFFTDGIANDTLSQFTDNTRFNNSLGTNITYSEPFGRRMQAQFSYRTNFSWDDADQKTFDLTTSSELTQLDTALSNQFESSFHTHTVRTGLSIRGKKVRGRLGVDYQHATLQTDQLFPLAFDGKRTFQNILPSAFFRVTLSKEKNLRVIYRARTDEPSISQLQNVINNSNPLNLTTGNPDLQQAVNHLFITRYSASNPEKGSSFFAFIFVQTSQDYISNQTLIAERPTVLAEGITLNRGAQLTSPINVNGYWNTRSSMTYTVPSGLLKSNIAWTTGARFSRLPGFINEEENIAENITLTQGIGLASNISEKVDFNISVNANYNIVENSLQPELDNNFFQNITSFDLNLIFGKGFVIRQNINHQLYRGLADEFNQDFFLWNMSVAKKFLKDNRGELALSVFDLLNQNTNISREVTETFIEDVQTNNLQQYFMLRFTYNLRQFNSEAPNIDNSRDSYRRR